jgi:hypothetical protein
MDSRSLSLLIYVHMPNIYQPIRNVNLIPLKLFCVFKKGHKVGIEHNFDLSY